MEEKIRGKRISIRIIIFKSIKNTDDLFEKGNGFPFSLRSGHSQFNSLSQDLLIPDFPLIPEKNQREIHPIQSENQGNLESPGRIFGQNDQHNFRGIKPKVDRNNESIKGRSLQKFFHQFPQKIVKP
jgi:hypothetical protein